MDARGLVIHTYNMISFRRYIEEQKEITTLLEKQIIIGKGKRYGQVVFMAGGAGSGKGFARDHFLEGDKFKLRDVDEWKKTFLKLAKLKNKYKQLRGLDLRKPKDVVILHEFIRSKTNTSNRVNQSD